MSKFCRKPATLVGSAFEIQNCMRSLAVSASVEVSPKEVLSAGCATAVAEKFAVLRPGTEVYVNMVRTNFSHFVEVRDASALLVAAGYRPVPHLPVSRFQTRATFLDVVRNMADVGAEGLLVVGGNDLDGQQAAGACGFDGTYDLLEQTAPEMRNIGIRRVALAGHPGGNPHLVAPGSPVHKLNADPSLELLFKKAECLVGCGLSTSVVSQFTFDAAALASWTQSVHEKLAPLDVDGTGLADALQLRIGIPGPTNISRLRRIANICGVPIPNTSSGRKWNSTSGFSPVSGPSVFVNDCADSPINEKEADLFYPEDVVRAMSSLAASAHIQGEMLRLHLFPFGGLLKSLEYISGLTRKNWQ